MRDGACRSGTGSTHAGKGQAAEEGPIETAVGRSRDAARVSRRIAVRMSDRMRLDPAKLTVRQGDTVRFVVVNAGRIMHEPAGAGHR